MKKGHSRRKFLRNSGVVLGGFGVYQWREDCLAQAPKLHVRPDVSTLNADHPIIKSYKKAILAMSKLPASDGRNWLNQAKIHRNNCPHGTWKFLPWHRDYLYWFEEVIRELSGDNDFVLPYWNWTKNPTVPDIFWGDDNPLSHVRDIKKGEVISAEFVGPKALEKVTKLTDFKQFGSFPNGEGDLEAGPHDLVHGSVGGDMGTISVAAQDPIFWLHHANIDRIWALWNASGNANSKEPKWLELENKDHFVNREGKSALSRKVSDLTSTYKLNYRYDDQPESEIKPFNLADFKPIENLHFTSTNATPVAGFKAKSQAIDVDPQLLSLAREQFSLPEKVAKTKVVQLWLGEIPRPKNPRCFLRVFLNCSYLSAATPVSDPHYVTTIGFFQNGEASDDPHSGHHGLRSIGLDVTDVLGAQTLPLNQPVQAGIVAVPLRAGDGDVEILVQEFQLSALTSV